MYLEDDLGIDHKSRLKRQMEAYEEAEREGNNAEYTGSNNAGESKNIL